MTAILSRANTLKQPREVVWAVLLSVVNAVGGVIYTIAWPDLDDRGTVMTVSIVLAVLLLAASWFTWNGVRRGAIALLVVNAVNVLLTIPAFFADLDGASIAGAVVSLVLSAGAIAALWMAPARAYWDRKAAAG